MTVWEGVGVVGEILRSHVGRAGLVWFVLTREQGSCDGHLGGMASIKTVLGSEVELSGPWML